MSEIPAADYCREIERYLCRRNGGHLVRIVGPAFEQVVAWASRGIPVKVAFRGIDRCVDREDAKGPRRRPVRVEFCDADVLDAFDDWRRAIGAEAGVSSVAAEVGAPDPASTPPDSASTDPDSTDKGSPRRVALQRHVDRVMARLTQRRIEADLPSALAPALDRALEALDELRPSAHGVRGQQRQAVTLRLREIDAMLMAAVRADSPPADITRTETEARRDLQPFKDRMPGDTFERAVIEEATRQLREALRLAEVAIVA